MATIVILEHRMQDRLGLPYMIYAIAERWQAQGHRVLVHRGTDNPPSGDVAVLNIDVTVVPPEYCSLLKRYRRVVNGSVLDVSKRPFSQDLLDRNDSWSGPVIVKTDANYGGRPDQDIRGLCLRYGFPCEIPPGPTMTSYLTLGSIREVPETVWNTPGLIVERFLPEEDERGYYIRFWTFFGECELSSRYRAAVPIIKSQNILEREAVPVPDEIRAWREKLGFDFGKFDYVRHAGRYVLLDVNRTPAAPVTLSGFPHLVEGMKHLADGLDGILRRGGDLSGARA